MATKRHRGAYTLVACLSLAFACKTSETPPASVESASATKAEAKDLRQIEYAITIHSTADKVWDVLADFGNYSKWNQWVPRLEGKAEVGAIVKAYASSGPQLDLKITSLVKPKEICWVDVTWFTKFGAGGWRCRRIEELPNGAGIRFVNHFEYTGIFASALQRATIDFLQQGMQQENENLKDFVEKS